LAKYEQFRESLVARDVGTPNPQVAERVLRECQLTPASDDLMSALGRLAALTQGALETNKTTLSPHIAAYYAYSLAITAYRRGDYALAETWSERATNYHHDVQSRDVSVQLISAMAHARLGQMDVAKGQLAASRKIIETAFQNGISKSKNWQGFWFDWVCARVHLREATALIEGPADSDE
jgi:hypothetical protein